MKRAVRILLPALLVLSLLWGGISCSRERLERENPPAATPSPGGEDADGEESGEEPSPQHGPYYIPLSRIDTLHIECDADNREETSDTLKTSLGADYAILWDEGDRVKVYYAPLDKDNYTVSTVKHGGVSDSAFDAIVPRGEPYYFAAYPEGVEATLTQTDDGAEQDRTYGAFEVVVPAVQDGKFENCHLAVGKASASGKHFAFKNVASYMQVVVRNTTATALTLQASDPADNIVGTLVVPFADAEGSLGTLSVKEGTGASTVTVKLEEGRTEPCTLYVALLPDVTFSKGFRMRYEYASGEDTSGFAYAKRDGRSVARRSVLEVGCLDNYIRTHWLVRTDGPCDDPFASFSAGTVWNRALSPAGLAALLDQPRTGDVQDDDDAFDRAWMLDGATVHVAAGTYGLSDIRMECAGYPHPVRVSIVGGHHPSLGGAYVSDTRDTVVKRTVFTGGGSRCLLLGSQMDLSVDKVWFSGCASSSAYDHGGALRVRAGADESARLTLPDCTFKDNAADGTGCNGGALAVSRGSAALCGCLFVSNHSGTDQTGGAIYVYEAGGNAVLDLDGCRFYNNFAGSRGGAVCVTGGTLNINRGDSSRACLFERNFLSRTTTGQTNSGGALHVTNSALYMRNVDFVGNWCSYPGGTVYAQGGALSIFSGVTCEAALSDLRFTNPDGCVLSRNGGYVVLDTGSSAVPEFALCRFTGGRCGRYGGAFYCHGCDLSLRDAILEDNAAATGGAAFYVEGNVSIIGTDTLKCAVRGHSQRNNSPFMYGASSHLSFTGCKFSGNSVTAPSSYGGLFPLTDQTFSASDCVFDGNAGSDASAQTIVGTEGNRRGALAALLEGGSGTLTLSGTRVRNIRGAQHGGVIYVAGGRGAGSGPAVSVTGCKFTGNQAESYGGVFNFDTSDATSVAAVFSDTEFSGNRTGSAGGVMHLNAAGLHRSVTCTDCTFNRNSQTYTENGVGGGVFHVSGGTLILSGCNADGNESRQSNPENSADHKGGGFLYAGGTAQLHLVLQGSSAVPRPLLKNNRAAWLGGAISLTNTNASSTVTLQENRFFYNTSVRGGGAIYWKMGGAAEPELFNVAFTGNAVTGGADCRGDAFCSPDCLSFTMDGNNKEKNYITGHTATCPVHTPCATAYTFIRFKFADNVSDLDGSLVRVGTSSAPAEGVLTLTKCDLRGNSAPNGGVIWANLTASSGASRLEECTFSANSASDEEGMGGAVYWNCASWSNDTSRPSLRFRQCTLTGNQAGKAGSAAYLEKGYLIFESSSSGKTDSFITDNVFHRSSHCTDQRVGCGGAVMMHDPASKIDMTNTVLSGNVSDGFGGALSLYGGRLFLTRCILRDNEAWFRGGAICQTGSDGFFLMKNCQVSGNRVSGPLSWGDAVHSNAGKAIFLNTTLTDGDTPHAGALINGSINLMMVGCTVVGNNTNPALRVEGNRSGLLLNSIVLNRAADAAAVLGSGPYNWHSRCGYNILGPLGQTSGGALYTAHAGDMTGKTVSDLGQWTWVEDGFYTWNGYVNGQVVITPAIDKTGYADPVSEGMNDGFALGYTVDDGDQLHWSADNLGRTCLTGWCSGDYVQDQRSIGDRQSGNNNMPGAYVPLVRKWTGGDPAVSCTASCGGAMRNEEIVVTAENISASTTVTVRFGDEKTLTRTGPGDLSYAFSTAGTRTVAVTMSPAEVAPAAWTVEVTGLDDLQYLMGRLRSDPDLCMVMCHRCNSSDWSIPENSLDAVEKCIADKVDIVEIDLQTSKDGHLVVSHDATLDRATTGTGYIRDYTLAQLKTLYLKDRDGNVTSRRMMTFEECLEACRGRIYIDVDIAGRDAGLAEIVRAVREKGMLGQVLLYCNTPLQIQKMFELEPRSNIFGWWNDNDHLHRYGLPGRTYMAGCDYFPQSAETSASGRPSAKGQSSPDRVAEVASSGTRIIADALYTLDPESFYPKTVTASQVAELFTYYPAAQCLHVDAGAEARAALKACGKKLLQE